MDKVERVNRLHKLKTWMPQFQHVVDELKLFDYRPDDRGFRVGDNILLEEWNQSKSIYTGRSVMVTITYKVANKFGIPNGYCILGIKKTQTQKDTINHCCEMMKENTIFKCSQCESKWCCPDTLIHYDERNKNYGIIIHDGGSSMIIIKHCPWCGRRLTSN